jgi:hypothetical protein
VDGIIIAPSEDQAGYELERRALSSQGTQFLFVDRSIPCTTIPHINF